MVRLRAVALIFLFTFPSLTLSQGTPEDYERSERLSQRMRNKVFLNAVSPHWSADGKHFWYRNNLPNGEVDFIWVDVTKGSRQSAFDHDKMAKALSDILKKEVSAKKLPIDQIAVDADAKTARLNVAGKGYMCKLTDYTLTEASKPEPLSSLNPLPRIQPTRRNGDETTIHFVNQRDDDVEIFWIGSNRQRRSYGTVAAGKEMEMRSFGGHVFLVVDKERNPLAVFEALEGGGHAVIRKDLKPPTRESPARGRSNTSPDGKWTVELKSSNIVLIEKPGGKSVTLTNDGSELNGYFEDVYWSRDSTRFVALRTARAKERQINIVESSPPGQSQGRLVTLSYAKPGDALTITKPHLFDVATKKEVPVADDLFNNPFSTSQFKWDGDEFTFLYNQRGHQALRLVGIDGKTGKTRAIIDETSKTFIDYAHKFFLREIEDTGEAIWMSERDGWNHLYLVDRPSGKIKNPIAKGDWVVLGVERVDTAKRQIWFRAGGVFPEQDPYYVHHCRINFDGSGLVHLTRGDGTHTIRYSPDEQYLIDNYSRVDMPGITELRRANDGSLVCMLERGDMSALKSAGWKVPERFVATGRDGKTDIHGVIYRPTNFHPGKKYPVIEAIYAGPQGSFVPKAFSAFHRAQEMAELGFILVQIDGMGTSNRSKAFHDVCWKNLADSGFPDRILWLKAAAAKYSSMDLNRVGIYGGSAGGQSALGALLNFGSFYRAAAADCGCHDNRIDKIWWNELWMGYPIGPHYKEQSNVTNAHKLTGKLLLTVGEVDRNVDPVSTMQVVNALIKAGKDFDLLVVPGAGHGIGESPYGARRRKDFFVRNLLGVTPPDRNAVGIEAKQ